ncbi:hypothetical protein DVA67_006995 [Solirubrobacter sp. CPCC 204708]|uniref:Uncharacterized protein n=1 Tax=Solirubrobacter deserti TaxID=2282478 RepID=A0ABT4RPA8_9ACTN|nr:hypothetical protein [Solirubrobacter deserti]MBE2315715.1 hypothetical protein [Solirubrobacter deserti]MDA0140396.1 hypothetical protein [Solirubrobacter deserti]
MSPTQSKAPTVGAELGEIMPLLCSVAIYGPPILFFVVPWLLVGVMLSAAFVLALGTVAAFAAVTALAAGLVTMLRRASA